MTNTPKTKKYKTVGVRLDAVEFAELEKHAKASNTDKAKLLRTYMYECQSGFDRNHEETLAALRKLQQNEEKLLARLELVAHMCASIAGGLISLPGPRLGDAEAMEARKNVLHAFGLAEALLKAQGDLFAKKGG